MFFLDPSVAHSPEARCHPLSPPSGGFLVQLIWPALTPALTEIRLFVLAECPSASGRCTTLNWNSWLFSSRRQAHFLLAEPKAGFLMPNVRAEAGTTAKRQACAVENAPARRAGLVF